MSHETAPVIGTWYRDCDRATLFEVIALDEDEETIEIQQFDGSVDEIDMESWQLLNLESSPDPEDYSGALDVGELDDLGSSITDTAPDDWQLAPGGDPKEQLSEYEEEHLFTEVREPPLGT